MEKRSQKILGLLLCACLLLVLASPLFAFAAEPSGKVVRVGWYESPFNAKDEFGRRSGYAYEFQQKIAAYSGWKYEYVEASWPELYEMLCAGEIDLLSDVSYTEERAEQMLFASLPMGEESYYIFVLQENAADFSPDDVHSLDGKRVGVNRGTFQEELYQKWAAKYGIESDIVELDTNEAESRARLAAGEFDAYVTLDAYGGFVGIVPTYKIGSSDFFFAVCKDRPDLLQELDAAMSKIQDENHNYVENLEERFILSTGSSVYLTRGELDWLDTHGPIRVGYEKNRLAFCAQDPETGELTGALEEFLSQAKDCMLNTRLSFETIPYPTSQDALDALQRGEIDCMFPISLSTYDAEELGLLSTVPLFTTEIYAVAPTSKLSSFSLRDDLTVAVNAGSPSYQSFLKDHFPQWQLRVYPTEEAAYWAVSLDEADCSLLSNYRINQGENLLTSLKLSTVTTGTDMDVCFALRLQDSDLYAILNKAIRIVPSSAINSALTYYSVNEQSFRMMDFLRVHLVSVIIAFVLILSVILALLLKTLHTERKALQAEQETHEALDRVAELSEDQQKKLDEIEALNAELSIRQDELNAALEEAQQASRAKTIFLSNMSHDIRTPMNAILGFTSLAKTHIDDRDEVLSDIDKIDAAGHHLLSLINDVLDMSRIESGRVTLHEEEFRFQGLLDQINSVIGGQCAENGLTYEFRLIGRVKSAYIGDELKLKQVLINILGNAVKFTPAPGTIRFTVEQLSDYEGMCTLRFVMKDSGVGMDKAFLPKLFDAFSQENPNSEKKYGSTGLGMAISKRIVDMMNGKIEVESRKGAGSTFTVTVTLQDAGKGHLGDFGQKQHPPQEEPVSAAEEKSLVGLHVLIVEDIDLNAELLGDLLDLEEITSDWAQNGKLGVERFAQSPVGCYDAILMDVRMPVMDGLEATAAIRALDRKDAKTVPIIAMSANAFAEDVKRSLQAGMNAHLSKPVEPERLYEALRKYACK